MEGLQVASTFTIPQHPMTGGEYIVFKDVDFKRSSPYDRVTFFAFVRPPFGFDEDPISTGRGGWTLRDVEMIDVLMDKRDNLPVFTIVEVRGQFCRVEQVAGDRVVNGLKGLWLSTESIVRAINHGTLELLS